MYKLYSVSLAHRLSSTVKTAYTDARWHQFFYTYLVDLTTFCVRHTRMYSIPVIFRNTFFRKIRFFLCKDHKNNVL